MITTKSTPKRWQLQTKHLQWAIVAVFLLLVATLVSFGGYYYWDRYVHLGDKSPLETDIEHMEQVIREDPQNPEARVALAEFYLVKGMPDEALAQAVQVIELFPDNQSALILAGLAANQLEQFDPAIDYLEQFVALRRDLPTAKSDMMLEKAYYFLGEIYLKKGKPVTAITILEAALEINRTDADALYQLGLAYQLNNQPEEALIAYHRAVRLVPDFTEAYTAMIESYGALEQSNLVAYARGMQAFTLQDYETAQTHLEYATQAQPDFAPAFVGLAMTYEKLNQLEAAQVAAQRAVKL